MCMIKKNGLGEGQITNFIKFFEQGCVAFMEGKARLIVGLHGINLVAFCFLNEDDLAQISMLHVSATMLGKFETCTFKQLFRLIARVTKNKKCV